MERQLKHLLSIDNSPFEEDPSFAFVFFNVLQKRKVVENANFRIKESYQKSIVKELRNMNKAVLDKLEGRSEFTGTPSTDVFCGLPDTMM